MNSFLGNGVLAKTQIPQIHTNMGNLGKKEIDIAQVSDFFSQSTGFVLDPGLAASLISRTPGRSHPGGE